MFAAKIKQDINYFLNQASILETEKGRLEEGLELAIKDDIIPSLSPHIPRPYFLSPEKSEVHYSTSSNHSYPEPHFLIILQLDHTDESYAGRFTNVDDKAMALNAALETKLQELAELYGVKNISIQGHPLTIG